MRYTTTLFQTGTNTGIEVPPERFEIIGRPQVERIEPQTAPLPPGVRAVPVVEPVPYRRVVLRTRNAVWGHPAARRATALLRERAAGTTGPS